MNERKKALRGKAVSEGTNTPNMECQLKPLTEENNFYRLQTKFGAR